MEKVMNAKPTMTHVDTTTINQDRIETFKEIWPPNAGIYANKVYEIKRFYVNNIRVNFISQPWKPTS